jgi:tetratricopeptide (TPR) repeat protein
MLLAWILWEQGRAREAAGVYRTLLEESPAQVDARLYYAQLLLYDLRDYDAAAEEYRSALEYTEPGDPQRASAEEGLRSVERERARRNRLIGHRRFLVTVLAIVAAAWLLLGTMAYFLTRREASEDETD